MNKLEKKSAIIGFFIATILFIAMVFFILFYIYPNIENIEQKKVIFNENYNKLENLKKSPISFDEFNIIKSDYSKVDNSKNENFIKIFQNFNFIAKNIDKFFYDSTLKGYKEADNLDDFLKNKSSKLDNLLKSNSIKEKEKKLYQILPVYSQFIELNNSNFLTNLKFVNNLEKLLYKHNIQNKTAIGIKNIAPIDESNIYFIPITLDIEAKKGDLLDFIDDINNSGKVVLGSCSFKKEDKKDINKGQKELNICNNNQIAEVESIELKSYIDNNTSKRTLSDANLKDFLTSTQQVNQFIKANIKLRFYINTLQRDNIISNINEVIGNKRIKNHYDNKGNIDKRIKISYNFVNLKKKVGELLKNPKIRNNKFYHNKILNIQKKLLSIEKSVTNLKKQINKAKNLDNIYRQVLKYKESFLKINKELDNIINSLNINTNKNNNNKIGITKK